MKVDAIDYARAVLKNNRNKNVYITTYHDTLKTQRKYKIACYGISKTSITTSYNKIKSVFDVMWPEYDISLIKTRRYNYQDIYYSIVIKINK